MKLRFNVFGRLLLVEAGTDGWKAFYMGADGKRRVADFSIPEFLREDELAQYLDDLFHEYAMPWNRDVRQLFGSVN